MKIVKRVGLVALLVVGVTLLASTPTWAGDKWAEEPIELRNVGDEPQASGDATLTRVCLLSVWNAPGPEAFPSGEAALSATLCVDCQNLTPGAAYWTPAGTFKANNKGTGRISGNVEFHLSWGYWEQPSWYAVDLVRLNPDGTSTTVLTWYFFNTPPFWW